MGGTLINYPEVIRTNAATLLLINIILISVIFTPGVYFMSIHLANFYLLTWPKFAKSSLSNIPEEIIQECNL